MDVRQFVEEHAAEFFSSLSEWLAIPSISADPARAADVRASAEFCTAITSTWDTMPMPRPSTSMKAADAVREVSGPIVSSRTKPTDEMNIPAIGHFL